MPDGFRQNLDTALDCLKPTFGTAGEKVKDISWTTTRSRAAGPHYTYTTFLLILLISDDGVSGGGPVFSCTVSQLSTASSLLSNAYLSSCPADTSPFAGKSSQADPAPLRIGLGKNRPLRSSGRASGQSSSVPPEEPSFQAERKWRGGLAAGCE